MRSGDLLHNAYYNPFGCEPGTRYFQLRLLFENNALSSRSFPVWDVFARS